MSRRTLASLRADMLGREHELGLLHGGLEQIRSARGLFVSLVGETGIGKSRLAEEFSRLAESRGARVLTGYCVQDPDAPGFWPWTQILRQWADGGGSDRVREQLGLDAATAILGPGAGARSSGTREDLDPSHAVGRYRVFENVRLLLERACHSRPLVLVFDDLHCADRDSLRLLDFIVRGVEHLPLLILACYRPEDFTERVRQETAARDLIRAARQIRLTGLAAHHVGTLVSDVSGVRPPPAVVADIAERTAGNPFFVEAMVRLLLETGALHGAAYDRTLIPHEVRETIRGRIARLPCEARQLLEVVAVLGSECRRATLEALGGGSAAAALQDLLVCQLLERVPATGLLRFAHPLIRDTVYQDIDDATRCALHWEVAASLEQAHPVPPDDVLASLTHHFFEARTHRDDGRALLYARRAAQRAHERFAYDEAVQHYQRALEALGPTDAVQCQKLEMAVAHEQQSAGDHEAAAATFERAVTMARTLGDARTQAQALIGLSRNSPEQGRVNAGLVRRLDEGLQRLGDQDPRLRSQLLSRLSIALLFSRDGERRDALSSEALAIARREGEDACLVSALLGRHLALWRPDRFAERIPIIREALEVADRTGNAELSLSAQLWLVIDLLELGDPDALEVALERYAREAAELQIPRYVWHAALVRATLAALRGELHDAERLALQARRVLEHGRGTNALQFFQAQIFAIRRAQGRVAELRPELERAVSDDSALPIWRCGYAVLLMELDDREGVRRELERLALREFASLPMDAQWLPSLALLAECVHFLGDVRLAVPLYEQLCPYASHNIVVAQAAASYGSVERYLGLLAETLGRVDDAVAHGERAVAVECRLASSAPLALAQLDCSRALTARGRPADLARARSLREEADAACARLGLALPRRSRCASPAVRAPSRTAQQPRLVREGAVWTFTTQECTFHLPDSKGLRQLATLLANPRQELHVRDLEGSPEAAAIRESGAGALLDRRSRDAYRTRVESLRAELEEAESFHDLHRAASLREELESIAHELARGVGLGGRLREAASPVERARVNVRRTIHAALQTIERQAPALGRSLRKAIRTGTFCLYDPAPELEPGWDVRT